MIKSQNNLNSLFTYTYIHNPDKGCGVVILNRGDYEQKVYDVINDADTFEEIHIDKKNY